jgi:hypothetical protein
MPKDGCVIPEDDARAFSYIWEMFRILEHITNHIGMEERQSYDNCKQALYEISISLDERLMKPVDYNPNKSILGHYYYDDVDSHPFRRFH